VRWMGNVRKLMRMSVAFGTVSVVACSATAMPRGGAVSDEPSSIAKISRPMSTARTIASAPDCTHQESVRIFKRGAKFAMPRCGKWTGTINYPPGNQNYTWLVTTSTTDSFGVPAPPSGTAILYMQTKVSKGREAPAFGDNGAMNTVSSPALSSGHSYTLIVYGFAEDSQCPVQPPSGCPPWSSELGSPAPNSHSLTFVSPLNDALFGGRPVWPVWQFVQD